MNEGELGGIAKAKLLCRFTAEISRCRAETAHTVTAVLLIAENAYKNSCASEVRRSFNADNADKARNPRVADSPQKLCENPHKLVIDAPYTNTSHINPLPLPWCTPR